MKNAEIVLKLRDYSNETFEAGKTRANLNYITMSLYQYQVSLSDPVTEIEQDIVWAALKIEPDVSKWAISLSEYESALNSKDLDPRGRRARIAAVLRDIPDNFLGSD